MPEAVAPFQRLTYPTAYAIGDLSDPLGPGRDGRLEQMSGAMTEVRAQQEAYRDYAVWKGWAGAFRHSSADNSYFGREFLPYVRSGGSVLEIGFGNGAFLSWCREQRLRVKGVELLPELVESARRAGFEAVSYDELPSGERFNAIVAISVLEHLDPSTLRDVLRYVSEHLTEDGVAIFRVPNGMSPFGRVYQYGDITHVQTITPSMLTQVLSLNDIDLVVDKVKNPAWPLGLERGPIFALVNAVRLCARWSLYQLLAAVVRLPPQLDPNLVVHLRRQKSE